MGSSLPYFKASLLIILKQANCTHLRLQSLQNESHVAHSAHSGKGRNFYFEFDVHFAKSSQELDCTHFDCVKPLVQQFPLSLNLCLILFTASTCGDIISKVGILWSTPQVCIHDDSNHMVYQFAHVWSQWVVGKVKVGLPCSAFSLVVSDVAPWLTINQFASKIAWVSIVLFW